MSAPARRWGTAHRFFLPNEDARPVATALGWLAPPARAPVFVGGSGLVLLEAAARAPGTPRPTFVDVAPFQAGYFGEVRAAVAAARDAAALRGWFAAEVYPRLSAHYRTRGEGYPLDRVLEAMRERFGLSLFFDDGRLARARAAACAAEVVVEDIGAYLARCVQRHDFVYLGNVPDYLDADALPRLLAACRRHDAPVYALITSASGDPGAFLPAAAAAGLDRDPRSCMLDGQNRGLGARTLDRPWNRPGTVHLLAPRPAAGGPP